MELYSRDSVRKARELQAQREDARLVAHARIADMLRSQRAPEVLASANRQLRLWREKHLCSSDYILEWSELLQRPPEALAAFIESNAPSARRLRQNTPFAQFLRA